MSIAFVFPGQGSQKVGMLAEWYAHSDIVKQTFSEAEDTLNLPLWAMTQDSHALSLTENVQPILLASSTALWRVWQQHSTIKPNFASGHSLGEYSALVMSGALAFKDAIRLVHTRGKLMQSAVPEGEGAMAAVLGLDDASVIAICEHISAEHQTVVSAANFNAPGQVVIAGTTSGVGLASAALKENKARIMPLPVSVPSHCALMQPAAEKLADVLAGLSLTMPSPPVIHNVSSEAASDVNIIKSQLAVQLYNAVNWTGCMHTLTQQGVTTLIECGFGQVLTGLQKRINPSTNVFGIDTPSKLTDTLAALSAA